MGSPSQRCLPQCREGRFCRSAKTPFPDHVLGNGFRRFSSPSSSLRIGVRCGSPAQENTDIARHAARIVEDLEADMIALGPELTLPERVDIFGNADQCLLPALLGLVYGAPVVGAEGVGE